MMSWGRGLSQPQQLGSNPNTAVINLAKDVAARIVAVARQIFRAAVLCVSIVASIALFIVLLPSIVSAIDAGVKRYEQHKVQREAEERKKLAACHQYDIRLAFLSQKAKDYSSLEVAKTVMRREFQKLERLHRICRG